MLLCDTCHKIYFYDLLKRQEDFQGKCRKKSCQGNIIHIDDQLVDVILKLWRLKVKTFYSCAGHLGPGLVKTKSLTWSMAPYLVLEPKWFLPIQRLRLPFKFEKDYKGNLILRLNHSEAADWNDLTVSVQLKLQNKFIAALYKLVSGIENGQHP